MAYDTQDIHSGTQSEGLSTKNAQDLDTALTNMDTALVAVGALVALTDGSLGTASDAIPEITASYVEADIANSIASLAAKINEIIAVLAAT